MSTNQQQRQTDTKEINAFYSQLSNSKLFNDINKCKQGIYAILEKYELTARMEEVMSRVSRETSILYGNTNEYMTEVIGSTYNGDKLITEIDKINLQKDNNDGAVNKDDGYINNLIVDSKNVSKASTIAFDSLKELIRLRLKYLCSMIIQLILNENYMPFKTKNLVNGGRQTRHRLRRRSHRRYTKTIRRNRVNRR